MNPPEHLISPELAEQLGHISALCKIVREDRAGIRAVLAEADGPARVDHMVKIMREASGALSNVTREMTKTADVLVSVRRRVRFGVRA